MAQERVIALVDMDCFYVQVEQRRDPSLRGKPCVVVQYKKYKGGGIIAVGYEARKFGVTRNMMGDDAKKKCPDVHLVRVPENRGKADLTHYREAGAEVIDVLSKFSDCLERASVDEAYIDLTVQVKRYLERYSKEEIALKVLSTTHVFNVCEPSTEDHVTSTAYKRIMTLIEDEKNLQLAVGTIIANEMRMAVLQKTEFTCSAGIGHNKMLAKLVGGMHKPNQQTLIFQDYVPLLFKEIPLKKVRSFGGKLGASIQAIFGVEKMGELAEVDLAILRERLDPKTGDWVHNMAKGIDFEPVRPRQLPKSIGCSKNFPGRETLTTKSQIEYWLKQLVSEVCERLGKDAQTNNRTANTLTVSLVTNPWNHSSRVLPFFTMDEEKIVSGCLKVLSGFNTAKDSEKWDPPVVNLGFAAGKFTESSSRQTQSLLKFKNPSNFKSDASKTPGLADIDSHLVTKEMKKQNQAVGLKRYLKPNETGSSTYLQLSYSTNDCLEDKSRWPSNQSTDDSNCKDTNVSTGDLSVSTITCPTELKAPTTPHSITNSSMTVDTGLLTSSVPCSSAEVGIQEKGRPLTNVQATGTTSDNLMTSTSRTLEFYRRETNDRNTGFEDWIRCEKCSRKILVWELEEHLDFHVAKELSRELNCNTQNSPRVGGKEQHVPPKKKPKIESGSISAFFKPKT